MDADLDCPGAADDPGAGVLLRRAGPLEERAQHDDDELHLARIRRGGLGGGRLFARLQHRATTGSATRRACSCAAWGSSRRARSPTYLFMAYQGTFCIITAALISGAIVERMRFSAYLIFITAVGPRRLLADRALGVGRRLAGRHGRARLRRRHRRARQRGRRGARRRYRRRQAPRLSRVAASAAQRAVYAARCRIAVVRLVRIQCRQRAGRQRARCARVHDDVPRADGHAGRLDAARLLALGQADRRRRRDRHRRRPRGDYASGRLHRSDERHRARRRSPRCRVTSA